MRSAVLERMPSMERITDTANNKEPNDKKEEKAPATEKPVVNLTQPNQANDLLDLLVDPSPTIPPHQPTKDTTSGGALLDLLGGIELAGITPLIAFNKNGLMIEFSFQRADSLLSITMRASNSTGSDMTDFVFQAAIPKSFQIQILSPSGNIIPAFNNGAVTQVIKLLNPQKQPLKMRLRLCYSQTGNAVQETCEISHFPPQCWQ
ncbi:AP-1 complex subunit gamma-1-like [Protopterus annectens]|uniref:AP-1 complex subunit gamma-1-like n=1 Tax=Protopterus annectens TaxID=7888 RepID=UPI001CFA328D|nr:AP-1 complex subunit gamma-1-like [Protopterus annectens]